MSAITQIEHAREKNLKPQVSLLRVISAISKSPADPIRAAIKRIEAAALMRKNKVVLTYKHQDHLNVVKAFLTENDFSVSIINETEIDKSKKGERFLKIKVSWSKNGD